MRENNEESIVGAIAGSAVGGIVGFILGELIIHFFTGSCVLATLLQMLMKYQK